MPDASLALSNLRGIVIIIVLAFHSALAYLASVPGVTPGFDQAPYPWQAFPIVDTNRWLGFDVFCAWQDVSLMSLMFLLSALFAAPSLSRKGARTYASDRLWRIGVPFVLALVVLNPLALYPAYVIRTANPSLADFWQQWTSLPFWPTGPQWFLCLLLILNLGLAGLFAVAPGFLARLGRLAALACEQPAKSFAIVMAISLVAYVPLALVYSPWEWLSVGPLSMQLSRPGQYVLYFAVGLALGQMGLNRGLLNCDGPLARRWLFWLIAAVVTFFAWAGLTSLTMPAWAAAPPAARIGATVAYPFACAAGCLFLLAVSLRFCRGRSKILDTLSANAYSMYLVHYVFVVWLQYAFLGSSLSPIAKFAIVLGCSLILSWASSAAFNRYVLAHLRFSGQKAVAPVPR